jgi:cell division protein FtsB
MLITFELRRRLRQAIAPTIGACVFGYFVYHAIQGERGLIAWLQTSEQLKASQATLTALTAERQAIEHRVNLLSPKSLDPDMLDEQARVMLNLATSGDRIVVIRQPGPMGN